MAGTISLIAFEVLFAIPGLLLGLGLIFAPDSTIRRMEKFQRRLIAAILIMVKMGLEVRKYPKGTLKYWLRVYLFPDTHKGDKLPLRMVGLG